MIRRCTRLAGLWQRRGGAPRGRTKRGCCRRIRRWDTSTPSSGVNEPQINVDYFYHRPVYHVGLLDDKSEIPGHLHRTRIGRGGMWQRWRFCAVSAERPSWMSMAATMGRAAASCGAFQRLGYDETILALYDEALRDGDLLLQVPVRPAAVGVVELLQHHMFTMWATSGQARLSSSPASKQTDRHLPRHPVNWERVYGRLASTQGLLWPMPLKPPHCAPAAGMASAPLATFWAGVRRVELLSSGAGWRARPLR